MPDLVHHRWNRGFRWEDHPGPHTVLSAEQARQYDELGYLVLPDVFTADDLAPVIAELDAREAEIDEFLATLESQRLSIAERGAITFAPNLAQNPPQLVAFSGHEVFLGLCADLLGPDVNLYWDQAVYKKPDKPRRFPWHQDNAYTFVEPQHYLTCWVALTDATIENGCPQVAPRLHREGTLVHDWVEPLGWQAFEEPPRIEAAPVGAGGVVAFSSLTPHMTGPNRTHAVRKAYILQYAPAGAIALDEGAHGEIRRRTLDDPALQYPVLRAGRSVAPGS